MTRSSFVFVPSQSFLLQLTDEDLFKKYKLSIEEINFIDATIRPMEISGGANNE